MKILYCNKCNKKVGEINKGKIKIDTILICKSCNKPNIKNPLDDIFNGFNDFMKK